jgi:hypothetical protein
VDARASVLAIEPGQRAGLVVVGPEHHRQVVGEVTAVDEQAIEIRLADPRHQSDLAPGVLVSLRTSAHRPAMAQVLAVSGGWEPAVIVRTVGTGGTEELRGSLRHLLVQPLDVLATVLTDGKASSFRLRVTDLSDGGAGLIMARALVTGDQIHMRLALHVEAPSALTFTGEVVWVREFQNHWRAGIQFSALSSVHQKALRDAAHANEADWLQALELAAGPD